jgi:16S rRNA (guanine(966)-N(2))-methyltransferase RsmD
LAAGCIIKDWIDKMRVIAGTARSLHLETLEGSSVRPTTDRIKETIFNVINQNVYEATFLDVFSGSGAMGIEALSRGCKKSYFIEKCKDASKCIENNLIHTKLIDKAEIMQYDYSMALNLLSQRKIQFDIIFLDPPYNNGLEKETILKIYDLGLLNRNGRLICESAASEDFSFIEQLDDFNIQKEKKYKTTKITYIAYNR